MDGNLLRGRVVSVRPRADGSFAVTLVGDPKGKVFYWMLASQAPPLGGLLEVSNATFRRFEGVQDAESVTLIEGGRTRLKPDRWPRRFVPEPWMLAAAQATTEPLYPHQREGAAWLAERLSRGKGAILADDQGLGKTLQMLSAMLLARAFPAIIVCPATVKRSWEQELDKLRVRLSGHVLQGERGPIPEAHVVITNYDLLKARESQLSKLGARVIVFDEGQVLKEPKPTKNHRAAVASRIAHRIGTAVILSGTPLPNRVHELWRLLHVIDRFEWDDFSKFKERYCTAPEKDDIGHDRHLVTEVGRVHRLDELRARTAPYMLRRLKSQVLGQLPPKKRRRIVVELEPLDRKTYDLAHRDVVSWLESMGAVERARAAKNTVFPKLLMLRRIAALGKLRRALPEFLETWFGEGGAGRSLVIFGYHRGVLRATRKICEKLGLQIAEIQGRDPDHKRQMAIERFSRGRARVFLAPIKAAGMGVNLQHGASDALFLERDWVPMQMAQAEDRIHRIGQRKPVTITYLDAKNTIDDKIAHMLALKQRIIDAVVDDADRPNAEQMEQQAFEELVGAMRSPG